MLQNESKVGATLEMPGEEEIGDAWGTEADIDFDGTGGSSEVKEGEGDNNIELGEGEGWDVGELEGLESIAPVPIKSSSAGLYVPPRPNPSAQENWCSNSLLAVDHIAAGAVESAMKLLNSQVGIVNFEPLKPYFLSVFTGSSVALPTISSISPLSLGLEREPGFPVVPISLKALVAELQTAYKSTTGGKFTESLAHFRTILHSLLFFAASKKDEETEARELLVLAREYVVGLEIELKRKELGESNAVRSCELAAYFTHTNLQPIHLVLSLRSAMNCAYKIQNFKLSASFAKRLLELNPQQQIATQARKLVAYAEQNNTNKLEINYDERNPFVICSASFTPIYKGSPAVQCPYCGSSYQPQHKGKLCNICGVSEIGKDVSGLIFSQPKKGRR